MNPEELKKLRQLYHSLKGQQQIFNDLTGTLVEDIALRPLKNEFEQLNNEFPTLMPDFDLGSYRSHFVGRKVIYSLTGIRSLIAAALGRLQVVIDDSSGIPFAEKREFAFIKNLDLRTIVERDYSELQKVYISGCWKSVIILCGGAFEAILADLIQTNESVSRAAKSAPKEHDISRWDLSSLIEVAVEIKLVSAGVQKLSHPLRQYRNLVHPGNELRSKLYFDAEEAKIAVEILNILYRDLTIGEPEGQSSFGRGS